MSKAWVSCNEGLGYSVALFADTRSKARKYLSECDEFLDYRYIDINPKREKSLDCLDKPDGYVMDWNNPEDRLELVEKLGWYCLDPVIGKCPDCVASKSCDYYLDCLKEEI